MNPYLIIILFILIGSYILDLIIGFLNIRHLNPYLPDEFVSFYDPSEYRRSQAYLRENTLFDMIMSTVFTCIIVLFILLGGFNFVDGLARSFELSPIPTGLIFTCILLLGCQILQIPFSAYQIFVIEEKYGFNRTKPVTFVMDILKTWFLAAIIGGVILAAVLWFFRETGSLAWLYCWGGITLFQVFLLFVAPVVIMPLFNKFSPLEEGELKRAITEYTNARGFKMKGVFTMDGSRRSTKSNAFLTGFGKFRRIVLFDTLVEKHTAHELLSVLAHEMGHYKKKHIIKTFILSFLTTGLMLFILSFFIKNQGIFDAFGMQKTSIYASIIFFGFLYSPIDTLLSILANALSRRNEYEADMYSVQTYGKPVSFINALKKLSMDNLSNLTPHPLKVIIEYSHPPVLDRIRLIRDRAGKNEPTA